MIDLGLVDPMVKNETLGFIRLYVKISPMAEGENSVAAHEDKEKRHNSKVWSSVLTVTLLEGNDLPAMDQNGKAIMMLVDPPGESVCMHVGWLYIKKVVILCWYTRLL